MAALWVLNLDAEEELGTRAGYTPSAQSLLQTESHAAQVAKVLCAPGDRVWAEGVKVAAGEGVIGRAWCPTTRAQSLLRAAGAEPLPSPSMDVLRRVNDRRFCAELGVTLPGAVFATDEGAVLGALGEGPVLLKRSFGFAGRGRKVVLGGTLTDADLAWVRASFRDGQGLSVEPFVGIEAEFSVHGTVSEDGSALLRGMVQQECDTRGRWLSARPLLPGRLSADERGMLEAEFARVSGALASAGYFGPFGIDAYRYIDAADERQWNTRSEINARYTMAWGLSG